jgi:MFS family permease
MSCVTVLNVMDRQLLAVLIDPIKRDLGVSDAAMGLLSGTSFALLHVAATIPIAVWADRGVRRSIIALGLGVWSGLTVLTGFARNFGEMFVIRVGVGIGEATGGGPAQSLLSDVFPPERRATALSILVMGGPLGSMVAFAAGGWLGDTLGWRAAFVIFGAPGLVLAVLIRLLVREPRRGAFDVLSSSATASSLPSTDEAADFDAAAAQVVVDEDPGTAGPRVELAPVPFAEAARFLFGVPSIRNTALACGLNAVGIYSILIWGVPYLSRVHGFPTAEAGIRLAIASALFTALGTLAGGPIADRLAAWDPSWLARMPAITSALVFPFGVAFALAPSGDLASLLLAPASFLAGAQFGPTYSAVQTLAPPQMRALAAAGVTMMNTILGLGLAPPLVGWLNDLGAASYGNDSIRYSLALMMVSHLVASWLLLRSSKTLEQNLRERDRFVTESP